MIIADRDNTDLLLAINFNLVSSLPALIRYKNSPELSASNGDDDDIETYGENREFYKSTINDENRPSSLPRGLLVPI